MKKVSYCFRSRNKQKKCPPGKALKIEVLKFLSPTCIQILENTCGQIILTFSKGAIDLSNGLYTQTFNSL